MHDARNRGAVLGADDEHVAAVAIGDDLLLQVLRRVLAAQVRLERAAQPRPLLAQAIAQVRAAPGWHRRRLRRRDRSCGGCRRSRARTRRRSRRCAREERESRCARGGSRRTCARPTPGTSRASSSCSGSRARPSTASDIRIASRSVGRLQRDRRRRAGSAPFRPSPRAPPRPRARRSAAARCARRAAPRRRLREAADRLDDPIEFEGPQGAGVHETLEVLVSVRLDRAIAKYSSGRRGTSANLGLGLRNPGSRILDAGRRIA